MMKTNFEYMVNCIESELQEELKQEQEKANKNVTSFLAFSKQHNTFICNLTHEFETNIFLCFSNY